MEEDIMEEYNDIFKVSMLLNEENQKLQQEKQDLKEWLEEEINALDTIYENLTDAGAVKRQTLKEVLERLN